MVARRLDIRRSQVECTGQCIGCAHKYYRWHSENHESEGALQRPRPNGGSVPRPQDRRVTGRRILQPRAASRDEDRSAARSSSH
jgi:hypothetical protein